MPRLIRVRAAAEFLGLSEVAVRQKVAKRQIPFVKIGRSILFDVTALESWIDSQRVPTVDAALTAIRRRARGEPWGPD